MELIEVSEVSKEFLVYKRKKGFWNTLAGLVSREYEVKKAVNQVSFSITKGEMVGYVGPNGAGKSTTIKMLCGILTPTSGQVIVDGRLPYESRKENALRIGVVFGQRSQLFWDLPMGETFELYKKMYKIEDKRYKENLEYFIELLEMEEFLNRPVRQLSLGQKMRANLAISMLHDPEIVYLDEPTIGLDVLAKSRIRQFLREVNRQKKTTVILTTHDMDDIEQICDRLIMIDRGQLQFDGKLDEFKRTYSGGYMLIVDFKDESALVSDPRLKLVKQEGPRKHFSFHKEDISVAEAVSHITGRHQIDDLQIKEPDIEEIIKSMYVRQSNHDKYDGKNVVNLA
ncbi:ABC transporter ATP-binding protein [Paenibacillus roseipurpureus]|uniref:ATP-binding cassette domain-containing protein n=1 Tax=Paenibacillus roseopurpureus TaxID=2918901 RepID=A0AA96LVK8_9BACL|nr:ATP-binding cassette domain-containing protein [Paenibacillus sp. MBLB1832]WNR46884.1 ATP-binding cassette domain-containing protein [Paenibacillus sp. MBLB1832]